MTWLITLLVIWVIHIRPIREIVDRVGSPGVSGY